MKKIPTLFKRVFQNNVITSITDEVTEGCMDAFLYGVPTVKFDGSCCAIINGEFYKRYDAKHGKTPPAGAIQCQQPDPITGHWPHWVKVDKQNHCDKWFVEAYELYAEHRPDINTISFQTFQAIGKHFNGNPYDIQFDCLVPHGLIKIHDLERTFDSIKSCLESKIIEGIVFWYNGQPVCKIKRTDFGFQWPVKHNKKE